MVGLGRHYAMLGPDTTTGPRLLKGLIAISDSEQTKHRDGGRLEPQSSRNFSICLSGIEWL